MGSPASSNGGYVRPQAPVSNPRCKSTKLRRYRSNSEPTCKQAVTKAGFLLKKRKNESTYATNQTSKSSTGCSTSKSSTMIPNASLSARSTNAPFSLDISDCLTDASQWEAMEIRFLENDKCTVLRPKLCQSPFLCGERKINACSLSGDKASIVCQESAQTVSHRPICRQTVRVEKIHVRNLLNTNRERCGNLSSSRLSEYAPPHHERNIPCYSEGMDSSETTSSSATESSVASMDYNGSTAKDKTEDDDARNSDETEVESSDESDDEDEDNEEEEQEDEEEDNSAEHDEENDQQNKEGSMKNKDNVWVQRKFCDTGCNYTGQTENNSVIMKVKTGDPAAEIDAKKLEYLHNEIASQETRGQKEDSVKSSIRPECINVKKSDVIECYCSSSNDYLSDSGKLTVLSKNISKPTSNKEENTRPASFSVIKLKYGEKNNIEKREDQKLSDCQKTPLQPVISKNTKTSFTRMSDEEIALYKQTALQILMQRKRHSQFADRISPKQISENPNQLNEKNKCVSSAPRPPSHRYKNFRPMPRPYNAYDLDRSFVSASSRINGQIEKHKRRIKMIRACSVTSTVSVSGTNSSQEKTEPITIRKMSPCNKSKGILDKSSYSGSSTFASWSWSSENTNGLSESDKILKKQNSTLASDTGKMRWRSSSLSKTQPPPFSRKTAFTDRNNQPVVESKYVNVALQTESSSTLPSEATSKKKRITKSVQRTAPGNLHPHIITHSEYQNSSSESKRMPKSLHDKKRENVDIYNTLGHCMLSADTSIIKQKNEKGLPCDLRVKTLKSHTVQSRKTADSQSKINQRQGIVTSALPIETKTNVKNITGKSAQTERPSQKSVLLPLKSSKKEIATPSLTPNVPSTVKSDIISDNSGPIATDTNKLKLRPDENHSVSPGNQMGYLELLQNILKSPTARASQALGMFLQQPDTLDSTDGVNEMTVDQIINSYQEIFDELKAMSSKSNAKGESKRQDCTASKQDCIASKQEPAKHMQSASSQTMQMCIPKHKEIKQPVSQTRSPFLAENKSAEGQRLLSFQNRSKSYQDWTKKSSTSQAVNKRSSVFSSRPTLPHIASSNVVNKQQCKTAYQTTKSLMWKPVASRNKLGEIKQNIMGQEATKYQFNRSTIISSPRFNIDLSVKGKGSQLPKRENNVPGVCMIGTSRYSDHKLLILPNTAKGQVEVRPTLSYSSMPPCVSKSYPTVIAKNEAYLIGDAWLSFGQEEHNIFKHQDLKSKVGKNQLNSPEKSLKKNDVRASEPDEKDAFNLLRTCPKITIIAPQAHVSISPRKSPSIDISTGVSLKNLENKPRKTNSNVSSMKSKSGVYKATQTTYPALSHSDNGISSRAPKHRYKLHSVDRSFPKREEPPQSNNTNDNPAQNVPPKISLDSTSESVQSKLCKSFTQTYRNASKKNDLKQLGSNRTLPANRIVHQSQRTKNVILKSLAAETSQYRPLTSEHAENTCKRLGKQNEAKTAMVPDTTVHKVHTNNNIIPSGDRGKRPTRFSSIGRNMVNCRSPEINKETPRSKSSQLTTSNIKRNANLPCENSAGNTTRGISNTHIIKKHATNGKNVSACFLSSRRYKDQAWWAKKPTFGAKKCLSTSNVQEQIKPPTMSSSAWKTKPYGKISQCQLCKIQPVRGAKTMLKFTCAEKNPTRTPVTPNLITNMHTEDSYSSLWLKNHLIQNKKIECPQSLTMSDERNNLREEKIQKQTVTEEFENFVTKMNFKSQSVDRITGTNGLPPLMIRKIKQRKGLGKESTIRQSVSCVNVLKTGNEVYMPQIKINRESNITRASEPMQEVQSKSSVSVKLPHQNANSKEGNCIGGSVNNISLYGNQENKGCNETDLYKNRPPGTHTKPTFSEDDSESSDCGNLQNLRQHAVAKTCEMILQETKTTTDSTNLCPRIDEKGNVKDLDLLPDNSIKEIVADSLLLPGNTCIEEAKKDTIKCPHAFQSRSINARELLMLKNSLVLRSLEGAKTENEINIFKDRKFPSSEDSTDSSAPTEAVREEKESMNISYGLQKSNENKFTVGGNMEMENNIQFRNNTKRPEASQIYNAFEGLATKDTSDLDRIQTVSSNVEKSNTLDSLVSQNLKYAASVVPSTPMDMENILKDDNRSVPKYIQINSTEAEASVFQFNGTEYNVKVPNERENKVNKHGLSPENKLESDKTEHTVVSLIASSRQGNISPDETQTAIQRTGCKECVMKSLPVSQTKKLHFKTRKPETQETVERTSVFDNDNAEVEREFHWKKNLSITSKETTESATDGQKPPDTKDENFFVVFPVSAHIQDGIATSVSTYSMNNRWPPSASRDLTHDKITESDGHFKSSLHLGTSVKTTHDHHEDGGLLTYRILESEIRAEVCQADVVGKGSSSWRSSEKNCIPCQNSPKSESIEEHDGDENRCERFVATEKINDQDSIPNMNVLHSKDQLDIICNRPRQGNEDVEEAIAIDCTKIISELDPKCLTNKENKSDGEVTSDVVLNCYPTDNAVLGKIKVAKLEWPLCQVPSASNSKSSLKQLRSDSVKSSSSCIVNCDDQEILEQHTSFCSTSDILTPIDKFQSLAKREVQDTTTLEFSFDSKNKLNSLISHPAPGLGKSMNLVKKEKASNIIPAGKENNFCVVDENNFNVVDNCCSSTETFSLCTKQRGEGEENRSNEAEDASASKRSQAIWRITDVEFDTPKDFCSDKMCIMDLCDSLKRKEQDSQFEIGNTGENLSHLSLTNLANNSYQTSASVSKIIKEDIKDVELAQGIKSACESQQDLIASNSDRQTSKENVDIRKGVFYKNTFNEQATGSVIENDSPQEYMGTSYDGNGAHSLEPFVQSTKKETTADHRYTNEGIAPDPPPVCSKGIDKRMPCDDTRFSSIQVFLRKSSSVGKYTDKDEKMCCKSSSINDLVSTRPTAMSSHTLFSTGKETPVVENVKSSHTDKEPCPSPYNRLEQPKQGDIIADLHVSPSVHKSLEKRKPLLADLNIWEIYNRLQYNNEKQKGSNRIGYSPSAYEEVSTKSSNFDKRYITDFVQHKTEKALHDTNNVDSGRIFMRGNGIDNKLIQQKAMENLESFVKSIQQELGKSGSWGLLSSPPKKPRKEYSSETGCFSVDELGVKTSYSGFRQSGNITIDKASININEMVGPHSVFSLMTIEAEKNKSAKNMVEVRNEDNTNKLPITIDSLICMNENDLQNSKNNTSKLNDAREPLTASHSYAEETYQPSQKHLMMSHNQTQSQEPYFQLTTYSNQHSCEAPFHTSPYAMSDFGKSAESSPVLAKPLLDTTLSSKRKNPYKSFPHSASTDVRIFSSEMGTAMSPVFPFSPYVVHPSGIKSSKMSPEMGKKLLSPSKPNPFLCCSSPLSLVQSDCTPKTYREGTSWTQKTPIILGNNQAQISPLNDHTPVCDSSPNFTRHHCVFPGSAQVHYGLSGEEIESFFCDTRIKQPIGLAEKQLKEKMEEDRCASDTRTDDPSSENEYLMIFSETAPKHAKKKLHTFSPSSQPKMYPSESKISYKRSLDAAPQLSVNMNSKKRTKNEISFNSIGCQEVCVSSKCQDLKENELFTSVNAHDKDTEIVPQVKAGHAVAWQNIPQSFCSNEPTAKMPQALIIDDPLEHFGVLKEPLEGKRPPSPKSSIVNINSCVSQSINNYLASSSFESLSSEDQLAQIASNNSDLNRRYGSADMDWKHSALSRTSSTSSTTLESASLFRCSETPLLPTRTQSHNTLGTRGLFFPEPTDKVQNRPVSNREVHQDILKTVTTLTSQVIYIFSDLKEKLNGTPEGAKQPRTISSRRIGKPIRKKTKSPRILSRGKKKTKQTLSLFKSSGLRLRLSDNDMVADEHDSNNFVPKSCENSRKKVKGYDKSFRENNVSSQSTSSDLYKCVNNMATTSGREETLSSNDFYCEYARMPITWSKTSEYGACRTVSKNLKYQKSEEATQPTSHADIPKKIGGEKSSPLLGNKGKMAQATEVHALSCDEEFTKVTDVSGQHQNYKLEKMETKSLSQSLDVVPLQPVRSKNDASLKFLECKEKYFANYAENREGILLPYFYTMYFLNNILRRNTMPVLAFLPTLLISTGERELAKESQREQADLDNGYHTKNRMLNASAKGKDGAVLEGREIFMDDNELAFKTDFRTSELDKVINSLPGDQKKVQERDIYYAFASEDSENCSDESESAHFSPENICKHEKISTGFVSPTHYSQACTQAGLKSPSYIKEYKVSLEYPNTQKRFGRFRNDSRSFTMLNEPLKSPHPLDGWHRSKKKSSFQRVSYCLSDNSPVLESKIRLRCTMPYHSDEEWYDDNSSTHNNTPHPQTYMAQQNDAFYGMNQFTQTYSCRGHEDPFNVNNYRADSTLLSAIKTEFNEDNKKMSNGEIKMKPLTDEEFGVDDNEPDTYEELKSLCTEMQETTLSSSCHDVSVSEYSDSFSNRDYSFPSCIQYGKRPLQRKATSSSGRAPYHVRKATLKPGHRSISREPFEKQFQGAKYTSTPSTRSENKELNDNEAVVSRSNKSVRAALNVSADQATNTVTPCLKHVSSFTQTDAEYIVQNVSVAGKKTRTLSPINSFIGQCLRSSNFKHQVQNIVDERLREALKSMSLRCKSDYADNVEQTHVYLKLASMTENTKNTKKSRTRVAAHKIFGEVEEINTDKSVCSGMLDMVVPAENVRDCCLSENIKVSSNRKSRVQVKKEKVERQAKDYCNDKQYTNITKKTTSLISGVKNEQDSVPFEKPLVAQGNIQMQLRCSSPPKSSHSRNDKRGYKKTNTENDKTANIISSFSSCPITSACIMYANQGNTSLYISRSLNLENRDVSSVDMYNCRESKMSNQGHNISGQADAHEKGKTTIAVTTNHLLESEQSSYKHFFKTEIPRTSSSTKVVKAIMKHSTTPSRFQSYDQRQPENCVKLPSRDIFKSFETSSSSSLNNDYGGLESVLSAESKVLWNKISCLEKSFEKCKICRKRYKSIVGLGRLKKDKRAMPVGKNKSRLQSDSFLKERSHLNVDKDERNKLDSLGEQKHFEKQFNLISKTTSERANVNEVDAQVDLKCNISNMYSPKEDHQCFFVDPCSKEYVTKKNNVCVCNGKQSSISSENRAVCDHKFNVTAANRNLIKPLALSVEVSKEPEKFLSISPTEGNVKYTKKGNVKGAHTARMVRLFETGKAFFHDGTENSTIGSKEGEIQSEDKIGSMHIQDLSCIKNSTWCSLLSSYQDQSKPVEAFKTEEEYLIKPSKPWWINKYSSECEESLVSSLKAKEERSYDSAEKSCQLSKTYIYKPNMCNMIPPINCKSLQGQLNIRHHAADTDFWIERLLNILHEMHHIFPQVFSPCSESAFSACIRDSFGKKKTSAINNSPPLQRPKQLCSNAHSKNQASVSCVKSFLNPVKDSELESANQFKLSNLDRDDYDKQVLNKTEKTEHFTKRHEKTNRREIFSFLDSRGTNDELITSRVDHSDNQLEYCGCQIWAEDNPVECYGSELDFIKENDSSPSRKEMKTTIQISNFATETPNFKSHDLAIDSNRQEYGKNGKQIRPNRCQDDEKIRSPDNFSVLGDKKTNIFLDMKTDTILHKMGVTGSNHEYCHNLGQLPYMSEAKNKNAITKDSDDDFQSALQICESDQGGDVSNVKEQPVGCSNSFCMTRNLIGSYMQSKFENKDVCLEDNLHNLSFDGSWEERSTIEKPNRFVRFGPGTNDKTVVNYVCCKLEPETQKRMDLPLWCNDVENASKQDIKTAIKESIRKPVGTLEFQKVASGNSGSTNQILKKHIKTKFPLPSYCYNIENNQHVKSAEDYSCEPKVACKEGDVNQNTQIKYECEPNSNVPEFLGHSAITSLGHSPKKQMKEVGPEHRTMGKETEGKDNTDSFSNFVKVQALWRQTEDTRFDSGCELHKKHQIKGGLFMKLKLDDPIAGEHSIECVKDCQYKEEPHGTKEGNTESSCSNIVFSAALQRAENLKSQTDKCVPAKEYFEKRASELNKNVCATPDDPNIVETVDYTSKPKKKPNVNDQIATCFNHRANKDLPTPKNSSLEIPVDIYTVPLRNSWSLNKKKRTKRDNDLRTRTIVISGPMMNLSIPVHHHRHQLLKNGHHDECCNNVEKGDTRQIEFTNRSSTDCNESRKMNSRWRDAMKRILPFTKKNIPNDKGERSTS